MAEHLALRGGAATAAALALTAAALLAGCGGNGDSDASTSSAAAGDGQGQNGAESGSTQPNRPPQGAAAIRENFPPPDTKGLPAGQVAAIRAGQKACEGKRPLQVRAEYLDEATAGGTLDLDSPEGELVSDPKRFRTLPGTTPDFPAGQLGADVYAATVPQAVAQSAYKGCVYELARVQARRLQRSGAQG